MIRIHNNCLGHLPPGCLSNLLVVIDWVHNSLYTKEKIFVNWSCKSDINIWENFFNQPQIENESQGESLKDINHYRFMNNQYIAPDLLKIKSVFTKYDWEFFCKPELYFDEDFQYFRNNLNLAWEVITLKKLFSDKIDKIHTFFGKKTLGVAVRIPAHFATDELRNSDLSKKFDVENYYNFLFNDIKTEFTNSGYDKIFIACDVEYFVKKLKNYFGEETVVCQEYNRIKDWTRDWDVKNLPISSEYELALIDTILLSKCDFLIGGVSNIFMSSLIMNKNIKFKFFEILKNAYGY